MKSAKAKKTGKIILRIFLTLLAVLILFTVVTFIFHSIQNGQELDALKEQGYYNPVSAGEYSLNVAKFGNAKGKHTIVGMAGMGSGDYPILVRKMTADIEKDNLVVFVDRAGYGLSDDTEKEMTIENIIEDYRTALRNAEISPPYVLMPHSIAGAYANYWSSKYPDEIEGIAILDGSQLDENAFSDTEVQDVNYQRFLSLLSKIGFSRYVIRNYIYLFPEEYSAEEQRLGDALMLRTMSSHAPISEGNLIRQNTQKVWNEMVTNDIPKIYICSSWGARTKEELLEKNKWTNTQIERNHLDVPLRPVTYEGNEEIIDKILSETEKAVKETLVPYADKMGNCQIIFLPGEHQIYSQKPKECGDIVENFLNKL